MTNQELIDYYADLLIAQYRLKPKAYATIQLLADIATMDQLPYSVQNSFNTDTAIGVQLDTLGKYQNVTRSFNTPTGIVSLDDDDFRKLIDFAIIRNTFGSDLYSIQSLLNQFFDGQVFVFDYFQMRVSYFIDEDFGSLDLINAVISQGLIPKPMGVTLSSTIYAPVLDSFFGFRTYAFNTLNNTPLNSYDSYQTDRPWLSYDDAI